MIKTNHALGVGKYDVLVIGALVFWSLSFDFAQDGEPVEPFRISSLAMLDSVPQAGSQFRASDFEFLTENERGVPT